MITLDREYVTSRYKLQKLKEIEDLVADGKYFVSPVFPVHGLFVSLSPPSTDREPPINVC
jgi:hypothetical protein